MSNENILYKEKFEKIIYFNCKYLTNNKSKIKNVEIFYIIYFYFKVNIFYQSYIFNIKIIDNLIYNT